MSVIFNNSKVCPLCNSSIDVSKFDDLSLREYYISGMCQQCQDKVFVDDDDGCCGGCECCDCEN